MPSEGIAPDHILPPTLDVMYIVRAMQTIAKASPKPRTVYLDLAVAIQLPRVFASNKRAKIVKAGKATSTTMTSTMGCEVFFCSKPRT